MYGFCSDGTIPAPSATGVCVANGDATATSRRAKKVATPPSSGTTQATRSRPARRPQATAQAETPVSTSSHRSSEPSWPPQNAERAYGVGRSRETWSAT